MAAPFARSTDVGAALQDSSCVGRHVVRRRRGRGEGDALGRRGFSVDEPRRAAPPCLLPVAPAAGIDLVFPGPARYSIEGSMDCTNFLPVAVVVSDVRASAARSVRFEDERSWRCAKLTRVPDGPVVAEITPLVVQGAVTLDVGTPTARAHLRGGWSGDERDGWMPSWVWAVVQRRVIDVTAELRGTS